MDKAKANKGYFLNEHLKKQHTVQKPKLKYIEEGHRVDVTSTDKDPFRRIIREALTIKDVIDGESKELVTNFGDQEHKKSFKVGLLNSKREFLSLLQLLGLQI